MLSRLLAFALFVGSCCAAACAVLQTGQQIYSGKYVYNWESSVFVPTGSRERWWIAGGDMSKAQLSPKKGDSLPMGGSAQITVRGVLGPKGQYGHMGCCVHELHVQEVLEAHDLKNF